MFVCMPSECNVASSRSRVVLCCAHCAAQLKQHELLFVATTYAATRMDGWWDVSYGFPSMDCWWDGGCYPCSYCNRPYRSTQLAWLCVDMSYFRCTANWASDLEDWRGEQMLCLPYELFSNLHIVWNDRYWPCSRKWLSKCYTCERATEHQHFRRDSLRRVHSMRSMRYTPYADETHYYRYS